MKSKNVTIWITAAVLFVAGSPALGWLQFKDGGTHNINYTINDDVWVDYLAPGMQTTVNLLNGGTIPYPYTLQGYKDSRINISGGSVDWDLFAYGSSQVTMSGGSVNYLAAYDFSDVDVSGGEVNGGLAACDFSTVNFSSGYVNGLYAEHSSVVNISGGSMNPHYTGDSSVRVWDSSTVNISGGSINYLYAYNSSNINISGGSMNYGLHIQDFSTVNISGGSIHYGLAAFNSSTANISGGSVSTLYAYNSSTANISGGSVFYLYARDSSTVTFYGRDFLASGGLILDGERVLGTGMLSGEWFDGTPWVVRIYENTATIRAIPEPASAAIMVLGATLIASKRRRQ